MKKMVSILIIFMLLLSFDFIVNKCYASTDFSQAMQDAKNFVNGGEAKVSQTIDEKELNKASSTIYNILLAIGLAIATIIGVVLGIEFITSGVEEQAQIKQSLIPYFVGCVVVFGSFGIWKIAINLMKNIG